MLQGSEELKLFFHKLERLEADELRPVPAITEPSQLGSVGIVQQFEKMVKEIIDTDDGEVALLGRRLIEDILLPQYSTLHIQNPAIYNRYQRLIVLLRFLNLSIHGMRVIAKLIQENLLTALKSGINVKDKFQFVLDVYHDVMMEGHIAEGLGNAVTSCQEKLGGFALLKDDGKTAPQTLENWMQEYLQMGLSGAEHRTGSLERIQFFKTNRNGQKLSEPDKQLLMKIFRLYDWLRYGEEIKEEPEDTPYMATQKFELPKGLGEETKNTESLIPNPSSLTPGPKPPAPVVPKPERGVPPSAAAAPKPLQQPIIDRTDMVNKVEEPTFSLGPRPTSRPVNIQDILSRKQELGIRDQRLGIKEPEERVGGLTLGESQAGSGIPYPVSSKKSTGPEASSQPVRSEKPQTDIDEKLEELKKKLQK